MRAGAVAMVANVSAWSASVRVDDALAQAVGAMATAFFAIGPAVLAGPPAHFVPKIISPAVEMNALRMMMASDELTTARVVAQPTPSLPPKVDRPQ